MPAYSNYPGGFANGVTIRGMPIVQAHPGEVFFVNNSTVLAKGGIGGSNGNPGTYQKPFATIDYAVGQCTAGRGDIIFVMPGHAETVTSTSLSLDVAGVCIVGLGSGTARPTLTFSTAAATVNVSAANVSVRNLLHVANFADVASYYTLSTAKDFALEGCEFRDTSSILNALTVVTTGASANAADGLYFSDNKVSSLGTTAATTTIVLGAAVDRMQVLKNFTVHAILNDTAALIAGGANNMTNLLLQGNIGFRPNTSSTGGSFVSSSSTACTGVATDNRFWQLDNTAGIWIATGTKLGFFENYSPITGAADKSGLINPAAV